MKKSELNHKDLLNPELTLENRCPLFEKEEALDNGIRLRRFEFNSRGARVEGDIFVGLKPASRLIVICHDQLGNYTAPDIHALAHQWAMRGALVATIDLPLQGRRANPKLTEHLFQTIGRNYSVSSLNESLWKDYFQQANADLRGVLQVLPGPIDAKIRQINFLGFDIGAACGIDFCAHSSENIRAALIGLNENTFKGPLNPFRKLSALTPKSFIVGLRKEKKSERDLKGEKLSAAIGKEKVLSYSGSAANKTVIQWVWDFFTE